MSKQKRPVAGWAGLAMAGSMLAAVAAMAWMTAVQVHDWMAAEDMSWMEGDDDD